LRDVYVNQQAKQALSNFNSIVEQPVNLGN